jgi:hypothetical protein
LRLVARAWWLSLPLSPAEQLRVRQDLRLEDPLDPLIAEVEAHVGQLSTQEQWSKQVPFLLHLPGVGMLSAMTAPFCHRRHCSFSLVQAPGAAMQGLGHASMLPAK